MPVIRYHEHQPKIGRSVFIAPTAWVTGKVTLEDEVTVLFGAALRGDIQNIIVGAGTNIQDNAVVHTSRGLHDCVIGKDVTVGHGAILHGCTVRDRCIIGMGCVILDDAVIEENCIIGANSLVTMGSIIPAGTMAYGSPAKPVRELNQRELQELKDSAASYRKVGAEYARVLGQ
jgi:carbonic anhydrase/acetyltransferase-like protein (isoleucine patch superfamily)